MIQHHPQFPEKRIPSGATLIFSKISWKERCFIWFSSQKMVEWFAFRIFQKLSKEIYVPFATILNFQKFLVQRKAFPDSLNNSIPEDQVATSYSSLHRGAPPKRCTLLIISLSISQGEGYGRARKSVQGFRKGMHWSQAGTRVRG